MIRKIPFVSRFLHPDGSPLSKKLWEAELFRSVYDFLSKSTSITQARSDTIDRQHDDILKFLSQGAGVVFYGAQSMKGFNLNEIKRINVWIP